MATTKLPKAITPHWMFQRERMVELNEVIGRYLPFMDDVGTEDAVMFYRCIAMWAEELKALALLEAEFMGKEYSNGKVY